MYDKFHVMQHANRAADEVRRAGFFRKGGAMRDIRARQTLAAADQVGQSGQLPKQLLNESISWGGSA